MPLKEDLEKYIDWDLVMKQVRYAGGHEDVMRNIFGSNAKVIASWIEDDYQGAEAFAYQFTDGTVVLATDYFGSCSGCDAWEDSSEEDARGLIREIVSSSRVFSTVKEALSFCQGNLEAFNYPFDRCSNLVDQLKHIIEG
jgi:hypothetical protein